ncbi:MAG: Asp-tRNA(Asn)/Glu-tRNA(Gln) amidotransferase GatCAB subunit B, partial [Cyanobacteria bacterium]|nr:Asp-tRNA(Asn)/Glu-tRNA(Gln) amidotransferase GatCAB subunit B [Cyanobacteriota bacterium]
RYFPEPDLVPLSIDASWVKRIADSLPELPEARRQRYTTQHGLSLDDASILVESKEMSDFYDEVLSLGTSAKAAANFLINWTAKYLKDNKIEFSQTHITAKNLFDLSQAIEKGVLGSTNAHKVLDLLLAEPGEVEKIIQEKGLAQVSDVGELKTLVQKVLDRSTKQLDEYKSGKTKVRQFFFGELMKETKGKGDPAVLNKLLDELLPPVDGS